MARSFRPGTCYRPTCHYDRSMPAPKTPTAAECRDRMRELAADTGNVIWTDHVQDRMAQRGIDSGTVLQIVRTGDVDEAPAPGKAPGDWVIKATRKLATGRTAGVLVAITKAGKLVLITTEWEDLQ